MLLVKKRLWDQNILLLPIVLSLIRLFPDLYLGLPRSAIVDDFRSISALTNGPSRYGGGRFDDEPVNLNPKSIEYLYRLHQSDILNDLTSLGRFSERNRRDIEAYVLSLVGDNPYRIENFSVPSTSESHDNERSDSRRLVTQTLTRSLSSASDLSSADLSELNIFDLHINDDDLYPLEYQLGDKSLLEEAIGLSMSMEEPFVPSDLSSGETLSQEDVDIIEILWKQDVDLGLDRSIFQPVAPQSVGGNVKYTEYEKKNSEENRKDEGKEPENAETEVDPWAGLNYIIDSETGEHLLVEDLEVPSSEETSVTLPDTVLDRLGHIEQDLIDENLGIDLLDFAQSPEPPTPTRRHREQRGSEGEASSSGVSEGSISEGEQETADALTDALAAELDSMLEGGMHHRSYPVRVPLVRGVNTDQRWQELAHLFTLPTADPHTSGHYHYPGYQGIAVPHAVYPNFANLHHDQRSALLHNASLAAPSLSVADLQANGSYPIGTHETGNTSHLGSAVAVSLNLTSNGTNSHVAGNNSVNAAAPAFKMEVTPDPGYYQPTADMPGTHQEGFFSSLLNDDDLHLMDVGMTDGAYGVRMVDANSNVQGGADSRSHPALSGADPARSEVDWPESHYMGYSSALRTVSSGAIGSGNGGGSDNRNPPQKKHQFYGKRFASDNTGGENSYFGGGSIEPSADPLSLHSNEVKYPYPDYPGHSLDMRSSALDALHHNHSYSMNRSQEELSYRPISRDKRAATSSAMSSRSSTDGEMDQACRDEKRARSMGIPITIEDIINLPMDEFNERLAKYDLSETQLSLIRDIRRRGKNKVAAQNCRKRKLDQIMSLADEVRRVKDRKIRLAREREMLLMEKTRIKERFAMLHRHVFQSLRDPDGNPYSPYDYSLQQSADGSVVLVPRMAMRPGDHELGEPGPSSVIRKSGESARNATA